MNILGYADKFSVMQNESIEFKVSCQNIKKYNAALLKIVQGDINDKGPGYKEIKLKDNLGGPFNAKYQKIPIGSYGIIRNKKIFHKLKSLSLSVFIFPTLLKKRRKQVILSRKNNSGFELFINNEDKIQFNINDYNIKLKKKIFEKNWYFITAKYNSKNGSVYISEELVFKQNENNVINVNKKIIKKNIDFTNNDCNFFIAANSNNGQIKNFYNGKIDSLKIYDKETKLGLNK